MKHIGKGLSFDLPEGWRDRSIVAYAAPIAPNRVAGLNVVVTEDELQEGESVNTYATRLATAFAHEHTGFQLRDRRDRRQRELLMAELVFTWDGDPTPAYQHVTLLSVGSAKVWVITGTAPLSEAKALDAVMERLLGSLRLVDQQHVPYAALSPQRT